jgi:hypothetical protein
MWKAKLNQHFAKIAFLIWNMIFHSLWLSALFYLSNGSRFNSLWSENHLLFATLSISLLALIFRDEWKQRLRDLGQSRTLFLMGLLQAFIIVSLTTLQGILSGRFEFLGVSSQLGVNFLSSYGWVLRSVLLFALSFSLNATTKNLSPHWMGLPLQCFFIWTWFQPGFYDYLVIIGIYALSSSFVQSTGLMAGILILTHSVLGSDFMGSEFTGLLQFKGMQDEGSLLHSPALILGLFFILFLNKIKTVLNRRKEPSAT